MALKSNDPKLKEYYHVLFSAISTNYQVNRTNLQHSKHLHVINSKP